MQTVILVLIEVLIVIGLSRLVGLGFRWIKQPLVIGEIVAGIMLGPSLFGWVAPDLYATVFPPEAVPFLNVLSQIGLIFFMFLIGLELNPKYLTAQLEVAILTSHVSILVPFFVDRGRERLETLLVPYAANIHDDLGLELALRLLVNGDRRSLTVLRVVQNEGAPTELSNEFHTLMEQLPSSVRDRIDIQIGCSR